MKFDREYKNRISKKTNNLFIKKNIEKFIKKNHKKYFSNYRTFLKLQLKLNNNKISKIYHPIRVSYYSIFFFKKDVKLILFAMLHNVLENKNFRSISIDKEILKKLKLLYIEKNKKYNDKYLPGYYKKLYKSDLIVKKLKCLDKLDNMFNLYKNKDFEIKKKYLFEIKKYILPLSKKISHSLHFYLKLLYLHNMKLINEK